jgi:hypothetical protein
MMYVAKRLPAAEWYFYWHSSIDPVWRSEMLESVREALRTFGVWLADEA